MPDVTNPQAELDLAAADDWVQLTSFSADDANNPRQYYVKNLSGSANNVEVYSEANEDAVDGDEPGEGVTGVTLEPGDSLPFTAFHPAGGRITRIWVRVATGTATVTHGVLIA